MSQGKLRDNRPIDQASSPPLNRASPAASQSHPRTFSSQLGSYQHNSGRRSVHLPFFFQAVTHKSEGFHQKGTARLFVSCGFMNSGFTTPWKWTEGFWKTGIILKNTFLSSTRLQDWSSKSVAVWPLPGQLSLQHSDLLCCFSGNENNGPEIYTMPGGLLKRLFQDASHSPNPKPNSLRTSKFVWKPNHWREAQTVGLGLTWSNPSHRGRGTCATLGSQVQPLVFGIH